MRVTEHGTTDHPVFKLERERRYKHLAVSPELLLGSLFRPFRRGDEVSVLSWEGLPDGCEVEAVAYDPHRHAFLFRLYHPGWPPVGPEEAIEVLDVRVTEQRLKVVLPQPLPTGDSARGRGFL